jgi:endonuclease YncB( thermonuclease family)
MAGCAALFAMAGCGSSGDPDADTAVDYIGGSPGPSESIVLGRENLDAKRVVEVISGDTVVVDVDGVETTIKIIGIRAPDPESSDDRERCLGKKSAEHLRSSLGANGVEIMFNEGQPRTDKDGNTRAHLAAPFELSSSVGVEQIRAGWATRIASPPRTPDSIHSEMFGQTTAEEEARAQRVGIWDPGQCQ